MKRGVKMKEITVKDIIQVTKGTLIMGNLETKCENFSKDTRQLQSGDVYVGIQGESFDGNSLYKEALEKEASVCILQAIQVDQAVKEQYPDRCIILVEDTILALQQIATYKRSLYQIPVIAITGSVGKTSTKDMVASVVEQNYNVLKTMGNYNNHIGVPLTILGLKEHTALVVEMGMSSLGEIRTLTNIAKPTIAVITNVGTAHIGNLGSRENILKAKLEIIEGLQKDGVLVINQDNDLLQAWNQTQNKCKVATFGIKNQSDNMGKEIVQQERSSEFTAVVENKELAVSVPVAGIPFVYNALCAITVGKLLAIPEEKILVGIREFELTKSRMETFENANGVTIINDCYNANYDSMKAGIEYLCGLSGKRKIAVLGDMLELGEYSKQLHEKTGNKIANHAVDILITVGKEARYIQQEAVNSGMKKEMTKHCETVEEAISFLQERLQKEDVVLVKASNGMKFSTIIQAIR